MQRKTVFEALHRLPAQLLVVDGLARVLVVPVIPRFKVAAVNSARSAYDNAEATSELEMEDIKREQDRQSKPAAPVNLALVVGLLTLTIRSEGMQQKIFLVVLVFVLFGVLSGVRPDSLAAGRMGAIPPVDSWTASDRPCAAETP